MLFTILLFLLPTTALYYLVFTLVSQSGCLKEFKGKLQYFQMTKGMSAA